MSLSDDGKSAMKIKKKDRIILGLSIVIAVMSVVIAFLILLKVCKKQSKFILLSFVLELLITCFV